MTYKLWHYYPMHLDHVSYVASHDQISGVVNRIGSQIGTAFIDGGIHPRFGTRNFTAPLLNDQYIEIVCPLDHPATDSTPFGKAVSKKSKEGGGWMAWVVATDNISKFGEKLGRDAVLSLRRKPNGTELHWKQLGVLSTIEDSQLPFFVEWVSHNHPSKDGSASAKISKIEISGQEETLINWVGGQANYNQISSVLRFFKDTSGEPLSGINSVEFEVNNKLISIS